MDISQITVKMIAYSQGNRHDVAHLLKVWGYAHTIGLCEGLDSQTQRTVEIAALVHDIACPLCRLKYGHTAGPLQEKEGEPLARAFLTDCGVEAETVDRAAWMVAHHHSPKASQDTDFRILLEADYLVNADESHYAAEAIRHAEQALFTTQTGRTLLRAIYPDAWEQGGAQ
jgi:uncharacterized protein